MAHAALPSKLRSLAARIDLVYTVLLCGAVAAFVVGILFYFDVL